jgi:hypothetical protein
MDATSLARKAKLSLTLIIIFSFAAGLLLGFALDYWNDRDVKYVWEGAVTVVFLGVALFHARNVSRLIH